MNVVETTYKILNLNELIKSLGVTKKDVAKLIGIKHCNIYRAASGKKISKGTFNKINNYFKDDLKYKPFEREITGRVKKPDLTTSILAEKLANIRAKQGRNPDGSLIGTKRTRMQEIEEEVKYENEKTERIKLLYKKQGVDLKTMNKRGIDINVTCNLGKTY